MSRPVPTIKEAAKEMRMGTFKSAVISWEIEVEHEAARLVKQGVPPWDAIEQARENVSRRRRLAEKGKTGQDET